MFQRISILASALFICLLSFGATVAKAVEIRTTTIPACHAGNSPGGCELVGFPPVTGTFDLPDDLNLEFLFILAGNRVMTLNAHSGYNLDFEIMAPGIADPTTLFIEEIALENASGRTLASSGFLDSIDLSVDEHYEFPCSAGEWYPPFGGRVNCVDEHFGAFAHTPFQQMRVSFSLDRQPTALAITIHQLSATSGGEPEVRVLLAEPPMTSLFMIGIGFLFSVSGWQGKFRLHQSS